MEVIVLELPLRLFQPFLGPRIVKTGLAVFLSLLIFHWVGSEYATFAAVAAILAVQPTVHKAREVFRQQFLGNLVAGALAVGLGLLLPINPLTMALGSILALGLLNRLKLSEAAGLAMVVILFIMDRPERDFLLYTVIRLGVIAGGMAIGYLVNRFIRPPDVVGRTRDEIRAGCDEVAQFLERLIASLPSPEHYQKEQIKQDALALQRHLETARALLELVHSSEVEQSRYLILRKANASMWVFAESVMDIHKLVLEAGGLAPGPEREAVTSALRAVQAYMRAVMRAALDQQPADPAAAVVFAQAMEGLQLQVDRLIDLRNQRSFGLTLHGVLSHIRHMGWRMASLSRLV